MKKFLFLLSVLPLAAVLWSCDSDKSEPAVPELTVSPQSLDVEASDVTLTYEITVNASDTWAVISAPDWVAVADLTEAGFTVEVEPYMWTEGLDDTREGEIVVGMGDMSVRVTVIQDAFVPEAPFVLTVDPDEISNADPAEVYEIAVGASHEWSVATEADWIVISGINDIGFSLQVEEYGDLEDESRTGSVVVSSEGEECEVKVTQLKPAPAISTVDDWLGQWTITAKMQSLMASDLGGFDGERDYSSIGEMVLREDIGENVVSIPVFGVEENFDEPTDLFFTFDPETGTLRNNNYVKTNGSSVTCTFAWWTETSGWKTFYPLEEGSLSFGLDAAGTLVVPQAVNVDGEEHQLTVCEFYPESGITWSMIYIYDITMSKN